MRTDDLNRNLRTEWHVLSFNGEGWNWSDPMTETMAQAEYTKQILIMPNCPAKLICILTKAEEPGISAEALAIPASKH